MESPIEKDLAAADGLREGLVTRHRPEEGERADVIRRGFHEVSPSPHGGRCIGKVEELRGEVDLGADRVQAEFERGHDTEIPATAPHGPEQVRILVLGHAKHAPVGCHDLDRHEIVDRESVFPAQIAEAAAKSEPADPGLGHVARGRGQPEDLRLAVHIRQRGAPLDMRGVALPVDTNGAHRRQVDRQSTVAERAARNVVSAPAHRGQKPVRPCEANGGHDVCQP